MSSRPATYTPGPLTAGDLECGTILQNGYVLYRLMIPGVHNPTEEQKEQMLADAKLYAAAPDLLTALSAWKEYEQGPSLWSYEEIEKMVNAAILKAGIKV